MTDQVVSSSSLVRTSGFHPGNSGSNPGETTKLNPQSIEIQWLGIFISIILPSLHPQFNSAELIPGKAFDASS